MKQIWFDPGVDHRNTGPKTLWAKKPLRLQVAIILAASRHRGDYWELLLSEPRKRYLEQADRLIAEGICIAGEGNLQRDLALTGVCPPGNEEVSVRESADEKEAA